MKALSKTEYENETNLYTLTNKLIDIGLLDVHFAKAAIYIAKSVRHLIPEEHEKECLDALETAEKYLQGEVTPEECRKVTDEIYSIVTTFSYSAATFTPGSAAYVAFYAVITYAKAVYAASASFDDSYPNNHCVKIAAYATIDAANTAYRTTHANADKVATTCDIIRESLPWEVVCSFQITKCFGKSKNEQFIQEITKDEKLINYATILLEDKNLRKQFKFLMKDYVNK